ncbi:MAG: acetate--CoA ligase family protein [Candidatus Heimdallarchaeaceae archaeon]
MNEKLVKIFQKAKDENRNLLEHEAKEVMKEIGVLIPEGQVVKTKEDAIKVSKELGFPLVMKLMSPQVLHKTDAKAVVVGIKNEEEVEDTFQDFMERFSDVTVEGVLIEKMVNKGVQIIIGTQTDSTFGPVILIGLGGVLVEILKDVVFRLCPTTKERALDAINSIKSKKLMEGFRDLPPVDKEKLAELMVKISNLAWEYKDYIAEMDLNPVIANNEGIWTVDARIILK